MLQHLGLRLWLSTESYSIFVRLYDAVLLCRSSITVVSLTVLRLYTKWTELNDTLYF